MTERKKWTKVTYTLIFQRKIRCQTSKYCVLTKSARNKKQAFSWVELLVFHRLSPTIFFKVALCQRKTLPILICIPGMCEVLKIKYLAEEHNTAQWRSRPWSFFLLVLPALLPSVFFFPFLPKIREREGPSPRSATAATGVTFKPESKSVFLTNKTSFSRPQMENRTFYSHNCYIIDYILLSCGD